MLLDAPGELLEILPLLPQGLGAAASLAHHIKGAAANLELVSVSVNPQVHAFDDATMVENTTSLGWMAETIRGFNGIVSGDYDHIPEQAFYMVGTIDEAVENAKNFQ